MPGYKKDVAKIIVKKLKKGGKVELTPDAKKIPGELERASKMHKGQAERLKGMGFGHGGEMKYAKGGAIHTPVKAEPKDVLRTKKLKKIMKKLKDKK